MVFPTGVGMFPHAERHHRNKACLPHRRGDVSQTLDACLLVGESSPQAWGCFLALTAHRCGAVVFPTGVGMFLDNPELLEGMPSLPHRRGDVSGESFRLISPPRSSPQAWGCFFVSPIGVSPLLVFPTGVGMFPKSQEYIARRGCLPHRRGDVSQCRLRGSKGRKSSPQAWGCFSSGRTARRTPRVFPTGVGMFPFRGPGHGT